MYIKKNICTNSSKVNNRSRCLETTTLKMQTSFYNIKEKKAHDSTKGRLSLVNVALIKSSTFMKRTKENIEVICDSSHCATSIMVIKTNM